MNQPAGVIDYAPPAAREGRPVLPWALGVFLASVVVGPFVYYPHDWWVYWTDWQYQTLGRYPWRPYEAAQVVCNYPPLQLYWLTVAEAIRRPLDLGLVHPVNVLVVKLPWIVAHAVGIFVAARFGGFRAAVAYALCVPIFVNAALWGQADAIPALAYVTSVWLLSRGRVAWAAAAFGVGLAMKLQAVMILPAIVVFAATRYGWLSVLKAAGVSLGMVLLLAVPMILGGGGAGVWRAYFGAVDLYPLRTIEAFNLWWLLTEFDVGVLGMAREAASLDTRTFLGLTHKRIGLLLLAIWLAFVLIVLWRRPTPTMLAAAAGLSVLGFFTLATQMHDRYSVPAAALLALTVVGGRRWVWLYVAAAVLISINQIAALADAYLWDWGLYQDWYKPVYRTIGNLAAAGHVALIVAAGLVYAKSDAADASGASRRRR